MAANAEESSSLREKCLLVSDSREIGSQYDSKRLPQENLVEIARGELYKKCLDMGRYLAKVKYETYTSILEGKLESLKDLKSQLPETRTSKKLKVVDGQVILVDKARFDEFNNIGTTRQTILEYLNTYWDIPASFTVTQVTNCMLRGVPFIEEQVDSSGSIIVNAPTNEQVLLKDENMPPHMHHSAVMTGAGVQSMEMASGDSIYESGKTRYDIFQNDSLTTGLDKNELEGVVDTFTPQEFGANAAAYGTGMNILHDNLPNYTECYVFVVSET